MQIADNLLVSGSMTTSGGSTTTGATTRAISVVAAAGATLGTATAIPATANTVYATVTLSSEGVKLPAAATGLTVYVLAQSDKGVKVYAAAAGQKIGTATTATTAFAVAKTTICGFFAISATNWLVLKGG